MDFSQLIARVSQGDSHAAAELVRRYESTVRVAVRTRLTDPRLRREFDSMDVCQSVLVSFFVRAALGQYELNSPAQLVALLTKMARNKIAMRVRAATRHRRDVARLAPTDQATQIADTRSDSAEPLRRLIGREILDLAHNMMTQEIRQMAELRLQNRSWETIAQVVGGSAEARRKQYHRAVNEIAEYLELTCPIWEFHS